MLSLARSAASVRPTQRVQALRTPKVSARVPSQRTVASRQVATQAGVEIAQIAGEAGFIAGTAFTMCAMTLVGLAIGFVLLRVESLTEEGKL